MKHLLTRRGAFTLIELLVVIAIIGILAALIIISLTSARLRAQDTQVKNNVRSLSSILEQYFTNSGAYPISASQIALNNSTLTTPLASYSSAGASSQVFTGYSGVTNGFITNAGGTTYAAAAGLRNTTEGTVSIGNGEYLTNSASTAGRIDVNGLSLTGIGLTGCVSSGTGCSLTGRGWVVYAPQ